MSAPSPAPLVEIRHMDGTPWWEAKIPRRWHKCKAQTQGWVGMTWVERCACGAIGSGGPAPVWIERNSRRKATR